MTLTIPPAYGFLKAGNSGHRCQCRIRAAMKFHFATVSLTTLVDSPVITGEFLKVRSARTEPTRRDGHLRPTAPLPLSGTGSLGSLQEPGRASRKTFRRTALSRYHFLFSLSDHVAHFGLEHHESDDSRIDERDWSTRMRESWRPVCFPMSTCIHGTESTDVRRSSPHLTTSSRCRTICSGSTKVLRSTWARC